MTKNFTHLKFDSENNSSNEQDEFCDNKMKESPSDSVIRNLLNYSRALSVFTVKLTGKAHMVLLN